MRISEHKNQIGALSPINIKKIELIPRSNLERRPGVLTSVRTLIRPIVTVYY